MTKVLPIENIFSALQPLKLKNKKIALCHGTFDLLHMGHVQHFREAKQHCDVLVITLTADKFVLKGPNKPAMGEQLRAEMLASLEIVDYVSIVYDYSAIPAITAIQPDFYVKGKDYAVSENDQTGKILAEKSAVENLGGTLIFTDGVIFSSTQLLNENFSVFDKNLSKTIERYKHVGFPAFQEKFGLTKNSNVLFFGDTIIDEYRHVDILGKSAKEPVIATKLIRSEAFAGGVIAAANHLASLCQNITVLTATGKSKHTSDFLKEHIDPSIELIAKELEGIPTTTKTRYVDPFVRKIFEVYNIDDGPMAKDNEDYFLDKLLELTEAADVVIVNDFGHGLITNPMVDLLVQNSKFLAVNAQTNSGNRGFNLVTKYTKADFICVDEPEFRLAMQDKFTPLEELIQKHVHEKIDVQHVIVTNGRKGCYCHTKGGAVQHLPAFTNKVIDTVGAGDAFFSYAAPLVATGMPIDQVGLVGNIAGAMKVNIIGHRESVDALKLLKYLNNTLM